MVLCCCGKEKGDYHIAIKGTEQGNVNQAFDRDKVDLSVKQDIETPKEKGAWEKVFEELKEKCNSVSISENGEGKIGSSGSLTCTFEMMNPVTNFQSFINDGGSSSSSPSGSFCLAAININIKASPETDIKEHIESKSHSNNTNMSNVVPAIGKPAPLFKGTAVINGEFEDISLKDYKGKYLVLFFYPLDFTFVCPTEIIAFSERANEFKDIGCEVVACSTDSHFSHLAWVNTSRKEGGLGEMDIPLLADKSMATAKSYGVLKEDDGVAFRGLFIIDPKQNLRQVTINDLPVGRDVDETLRLVQAFQFTDKHGEVCPAGWKPGAKTMKADPKGSKAYFSTQN